MKVKYLLCLFILSLLPILITCKIQADQREPPAEKTVKDLDLPVTQATWSIDWNKTQASARKESRLVVIGTAGGSFRTPLVSTFKEKFGIDVEVISGKGAEVSQKLLSEQKAGLYLVDVYLGGATTPVTQLKPAGAFSSLDSVLILPEVLDDKAWLEKKLPWVDKDHTILTTNAYPNLSLGINSQQVRQGEIKSYRDLLNPKWKGKIVLNDPTLAGVGGKWAVVVGTVIMNWDYMRELAKQEPVIITDQRLQVDWLAKGKYPVATVPQPQLFKEFQEAGSPIAAVELEEGTWLATGDSGLALVNKAPHPNAAKIFVNWLLTKEGQTFFSKIMGVQSARIDVPTDFLDPMQVRQPNVKYYNASTEDFLISEPEKRKTAIEIFKPLVK